jgi:plastocyanin
MRDHIRRMTVAPALLIAAACGGEQAALADDQAAGAPVATAAASPAAPAEAPAAATGEVIEIRMTMANGGAFEPSEVTASTGDVLRFVNVDNVHNVSFPAARNHGASGLPAASPYLTTPGQSYELTVGLDAGTYTFQCDPHAAMGMVGTLTVR